MISITFVKTSFKCLVKYKLFFIKYMTIIRTNSRLINITLYIILITLSEFTKVWLITFSNKLSPIFSYMFDLVKIKKLLYRKFCYHYYII